MKFFRKMTFLLAILVLLVSGCSPQPSFEIPSVTKERLAELEENIGVQLLKYHLKLSAKDFEILAPYLKTGGSSSSNNWDAAIECACLSPHSSIYIVSFEQTGGGVFDSSRHTPDYRFMYMADEESYFNSLSKTFETTAGEIPWPDEWGNPPENIRYMYFKVKNGPPVKYSFLDVDSFKCYFDSNMPIRSIDASASFILKAQEAAELFSTKKQNGFENVSVSPFYIWADFQPEAARDTSYNVSLQYKDGRKAEYIWQGYNAPKDSISELYIEILPPYLELDKISSVVINGAEFPLKWRLS